MFFNKSTILFSVLALCNVVIAAQPPACLLSVVGKQPNPADLKTICIKNGEKMQNLLSDKCDNDDKEDALKHFFDTCSANGHKVATSTTSGSSSTTTGSKSTNTGFTTNTAKNADSTSGSSGSSSSSDSSSSPSTASGSTSSSPSESSTVSAGASDRHVSAAAFAAVVFVGFAATM